MKTGTAFAGLVAINMAVTLATLTGIVAGVWWAYNHVVAPSFGWLKLGVH